MQPFSCLGKESSACQIFGVSVRVSRSERAEISGDRMLTRWGEIRSMGRQQVNRPNGSASRARPRLGLPGRRLGIVASWRAPLKREMKSLMCGWLRGGGVSSRFLVGTSKQTTNLFLLLPAQCAVVAPAIPPSSPNR